MSLIRARALGTLVVTCLTALSAACSSGDSSSPLGDTTENQPASASKETAGAELDVPSGGNADEPQTAGGAGSASGDNVDSTPPAQAAPPSTPPAAVPMPYRGVNLSGAEFGSAIPGREGWDYGFPTNSEVDYFRAKGMNTFRVGFRWERLQPTAYGEFDAVYFGKLDALVTYATASGSTVILNPHNFARYYGSTVGSSAVPSAVFADLWKRLATRYASNAHVMFNLVNEPHDMPSEQWVSAANSAIAAIRTAGAANAIVVPGNAWTGAHSWNESYYGTPNALAMLDIKDPGNNSLYEVHQYLDATSAGVSPTCVSATIGSERLAGFVKWLRDNGKKGFVGELAAGENPTCDAAFKDMLDYMMKSTDVLAGWTYWAAGPRWSEGYIFSIEPKNGVDATEMVRLKPYLF